MKHPIQPLEKDKHGVIRFKENAIVSYLLDFGTNHGCGLNELAILKFSDEDRQQLAQLIGYSLNGYSELSYVDDEAYETAARMSKSKGKSEIEARIEYFEQQLAMLRKTLREPMADLFGVHPDDLKRNG